MRKLGKTQAEVLRSLRNHHGFYHQCCGWVWDNHSGTIKILDSLVKRGLVEEINGVYKLTSIATSLQENGVI